eukprot:CAMPEP_0174266388 /NCGR_PEP_ID=MMETSP0439-20130205/30001_1 /TAXON_ID=0 /ORGANISM="Stereomyxa ramosa, Strain Chinc5" /LENGTH=275 /DNA_ID=CAMNT_0015353311 /DNA_START=20 /DNA_END=844 /DNA_ORIENTATION=+
MPKKRQGRKKKENKKSSKTKVEESGRKEVVWSPQQRANVIVIILLAQNEDLETCPIGRLPKELVKMIFDYLPAVPSADHYYPFLDEEGDKTSVVLDMGKSENKCSGEVKGPVKRTSKGFEFNGKNWIEFDKELGAFGQQDFSVSLWNRTTLYHGNSAIFSNRADGSHGNFFCVRFQKGFFCVELDDNRINNYCVAHAEQDGYGASNDGKWHHLVVIREGSKMVVVIDGEVIAEKTAGKGKAIDVLGRHSMMLGASPCASTYGLYYSGFVAEVMVW